MNLSRLDRPLVLLTGVLAIYGLAILYSAGQTDLPTSAAHVWQRQLVWLAMGIVLGVMVMRVSPRLLEWVAPVLYAAGILALLVTLVIGSGGGTAASSKSWITIGGHRLGQPSELVKLTTIVMLARYLAGRRAPADSLRELVAPVLIAAVPALLVMAQPDLGSALVFGGILFAMLYWSGVRVRLLIQLASPIASLVLAFSPGTWAAWTVLLCILLVAWRPYVWEGLFVLGANLVTGIVARPMWLRLAA